MADVNMGLTFVGQSGCFSEDTRATNKLVRSHVMRRYKRHQKASHKSRRGSGSTSPSTAEKPLTSSKTSSERSASISAPPYTDVSVAVAAGHRTCLTRDCNNSCCQSSSACSSPSYDIKTWIDGQVDPFTILPGSITTQRSRILLRRNASLPIKTSVHSDPSGNYRAVCNKDPAWLFMHLYYASCRFPESSVELRSEAELYATQSISAVNQSIQASPNCVDDSTIATVACLANIENLNGTAATAKVHINGLLRMVRIRGGLSNLGIGGILRRMVLWADLLTSLRFQTVPNFPLDIVDKPSELWSFTPPYLRHNYRLELRPELATITTLSHGVGLSSVFQSLHELSVFINSADSTVLPPDALYADRVYEVEHAVSLALYDDSVIATDLDAVECGQLFFQAALLFIYTALRETPVRAALAKTLLSRLLKCVDSIDLTSMSRRFTAEILWSLALGTWACPSNSRAEWLNRNRQVFTESHVETWTEVEDLLKSTPVLPDACIITCMELWALPV